MNYFTRIAFGAFMVFAFLFFGTQHVSAQTNSVCPLLTQLLSLGSTDAATGGQVSRLQRYLATVPTIYPEAMVTGYFGPLTEAAIRRFQAQQGIISYGTPSTTGYGLVGPRTRALLALCGSTAPGVPTTPPPTGGSVPPDEEEDEDTITNPGEAELVPLSLRAKNLPSEIKLTSLYGAGVVSNSKGDRLPKSFGDIPLYQGTVKDYSSGSIIPAPSGTTYGNGATASSNAYIAVPPTFDGDALTLRMSPRMNDEVAWRLEGTVGLNTTAPSGTKTNLAIYVQGTPETELNEARSLLFESVIEAGKSYSVDVSLLPWTTRSGFTLEFVVEKEGANNYYQGLVLDDFELSPVSYLPELSIARSNLAWESTGSQNTVISTLASIDAAWYRDAIRASALATTNARLFKRIQDQGKDILVTVLPDAEDYTNPSASTAHATNAFLTKCGWSGGILKLSEMDLDRFEARLRANLSALKTEGVKVGAFEIGNEIDWVCFNGDLPLDRVVGDSELKPHAAAYARMLDRAIRTIRLPEFYPKARIISFGAANVLGDSTPGMIKNPGKLLALLTDQDGVDYLELIDAVGAHVYPDPNNPESAADALDRFEDAIGERKQIWVTEWGFRTSAFTDSSARAEAIFRSYRSFVGEENLRIENLFTYALDAFGDQFALVDSNYRLLPEASYYNGF